MVALAKPPPRFAGIPAAAPPGRFYLVIGWYVWGKARNLSMALARCGPRFDSTVDRCLLYHVDPDAVVDAEGWVLSPPDKPMPVEIAYYP